MPQTELIAHIIVIELVLLSCLLKNFGQRNELCCSCTIITLFHSIYFQYISHLQHYFDHVLLKYFPLQRVRGKDFLWCPPEEERKWWWSSWRREIVRWNWEWKQLIPTKLAHCSSIPSHMHWLDFLSFVEKSCWKSEEKAFSGRKTAENPIDSSSFSLYELPSLLRNKV